MERTRLFVIGGAGFVGREVIRAAVARGWEVMALARSAERAAELTAIGATPVRGDAVAPGAWIAAARCAAALVDLAQPELPPRIGVRDIEAVSRVRKAMMRDLLDALRRLAPEERPLLLSVSGVDDLAPDARGRVDDGSPLRTTPTGFSHVGVPVRRLVEASGVAAAFLHLGTVYGPGKSFAASIFPRLARGRMLLPRPARNRLPLIHVEDAGRAIVHLAALGAGRIAGHSWILADETGGTRLCDLFDLAAEEMGVAPPRRAPSWLLSIALGRILFETLARDVEARPSGLLATGFRFKYPTVREGLPPTLRALGYERRAPPRTVSRGARRLRWLLAASLAALVLVNAPLLPVGVPALRQLAGGERILDLRPGYSPQTAHRFLEALGRAGRARYLEMLWTVDLALPALFSVALWTALGRGALRRWRWVGLAAGAADYLENLAITALIAAFPGRNDALVLAASVLTSSKLLLYGVSLALAIGGAWAARRTRAADPHANAAGGARA